MKKIFPIINKIQISTLIRTSAASMPSDHLHPFYELYIVRDGQCRYFIRDKIFTLRKGDFVLLEPNELHHSHYFPNKSCERTAVYFSPEHLFPQFFSDPEDIPGNQPFDGLKSGLYHVPGVILPDFDHLLQKMDEEWPREDISSQAILQCHLNELLLGLLKLQTNEVPDPNYIPSETEISVAARYISSHFREQVTLEEVSSIAGLSPTYFSKKFKKLTGLGFKEYLNFIRLKQARADLLSTNDTITVIALNNGFNDSNYFKDLFKKQFGSSPREYRKKMTDLPEIL
ncbi:MAG: AraC family transcriptional regulator [Lachnospiraceae bacterium]|nr:AraC family transcriptional regulator [Lachnospiraceae bacterium]